MGFLQGRSKARGKLLPCPKSIGAGTHAWGARSRFGVDDQALHLTVGGLLVYKVSEGGRVSSQEHAREKRDS